MANQINDLRTVLFQQLSRLNDPDCKLDKEVQRSLAMVDVAREIISSAKVEVDFMKVTGTIGSGFIPANKMLGDGTA